VGCLNKVFVILCSSISDPYFQGIDHVRRELPVSDDDDKRWQPLLYGLRHMYPIGWFCLSGKMPIILGTGTKAVSTSGSAFPLPIGGSSQA